MIDGSFLRWFAQEILKELTQHRDRRLPIAAHGFGAGVAVASVGSWSQSRSQEGR
jgi:hypothetical protein